MDFHDYKDLAMIYSSGKDGKPDYSWDKAKIVVWDPVEQQEMDLIFTGSERPDEKANFPGAIHFNVQRKKGPYTVTEVFESTIKDIFPNISNETLKEYSKWFIHKMVEAKEG